MLEAARTTASTSEIWLIVVVATGLLAFWLAAIFLADRSQVRASGQSLPGTGAKPALGSAWADGSRAGEQGTEAAEVPGPAAREPIGARGRHAKEGSVPEGEVPTRADIPAQSSGRHAVPAQPTGSSPSTESPQPAGTTQPPEPAQSAGPGRATEPQGMPAQRAGDADRARRSHASPLPPDKEQPGH